MRSTNGKKPARDKQLPLKRATVAEKEERVLQTMKLVIEGSSTSDIKQWFRVELDIQFNQALRYLRLARERLAEEDGLGPDFTFEDMRVQHYAMAMAIARADSGASTRDRIAALKLAGAMYGIGTANTVAPTTPDGDESYRAEITKEALRECSIEELEIMAKVRERIVAITQNRKSISN